MRRAVWSPVLVMLLLSGCSLNPPAPQPVIYDLGASPVIAGGGTLRIAEVTAPPWLDSGAIAYRLAFRDAQRREAYRDSRWAAPPAALLTYRLREQVVAPVCAALLVVSLEAFEQVFTAPDASHVVLRVSASLATAQPGNERRWQLERPAPSADAPGAVRGLSAAVDALLPEINAWLASAPAACTAATKQNAR